MSRVISRMGHLQENDNQVLRAFYNRLGKPLNIAIEYLDNGKVKYKQHEVLHDTFNGSLTVWRSDLSVNVDNRFTLNFHVERLAYMLADRYRAKGYEARVLS